MLSDANTLLWWQFNEPLGSTTILNYGTAGSAGNLSVTLNSGPALLVGSNGNVFGKAIRLTENNQNARIEGAASVAPTSVFSISVWFLASKATQTNNIGRILFKQDQLSTWNSPFHRFSLEFNSGNAMGFYAGALASGGTFITNNDLNNCVLNVPHLYGMSWDGTNYNAWIDGELVNTQAASGPLTTGAGNWTIGNYNNGGSGGPERFGGTIEEARVETVARPASWWKENWQRGMGRGL
jgi:hypothetical protein